MSSKPVDQPQTSDHFQQTLRQIKRYGRMIVRRQHADRLNDSLAKNKMRILDLDRQLLDNQRHGLEFRRRLEAQRLADERFRVETERRLEIEGGHTRVLRDLLCSMTAIELEADEQQQ